MVLLSFVFCSFFTTDRRFSSSFFCWNKEARTWKELLNNLRCKVSGIGWHVWWLAYSVLERKTMCGTEHTKSNGKIKVRSSDLVCHVPHIVSPKNIKWSSHRFSYRINFTLNGIQRPTFKPNVSSHKMLYV